MSAPQLDKINDAQDQVLETIATIQEPVLKVVRMTAERAESIVPEVSLSKTDRLPTMHAVVSNQFDFASKVLEQQRAFFIALIDAAKPVAGKVVPVEKKKTTTRTTKTTAKKAA